MRPARRRQRATHDVRRDTASNTVYYGINSTSSLTVGCTSDCSIGFYIHGAIA
jgi:hypothetical protein